MFVSIENIKFTAYKLYYMLILWTVGFSRKTEFFYWDCMEFYIGQTFFNLWTNYLFVIVIQKLWMQTQNLFFEKNINLNF